MVIWTPAWLLLATLVLLLLLPSLHLLSSWQEIDTELWQHFADSFLSELLVNTLLLVVAVAFGTLLLGVGLAWLVVMYEFPGRRWLSWLLLLPFAMPAYVLAFVFLGTFDYGGTFQQWLRPYGIEYFDIREGVFGPALVLTLVFYPYVYLLARTAFANQSISMIESARILGCSPSQVFWRVSLPLARPAIAAGVSLALMETLADFGTVALFNYSTFTTAIYSVWEDFRSLAAAAQLSTLLLLVALLLLGVEKYSRGRRSFVQQARLDQPPFSLKVWQQWFVSGLVWFVLLVVLIIPVIQLSIWAYQSVLAEWDSRYLEWFNSTLILSISAALATVFMALLLNVLRKRFASRPLRTALLLARLGYALPGIVLAIGIMAVMAWFNSLFATTWFIGGLFALYLAYMVRFIAVAYGPIESRLDTIRPSVIEAARNMGAGSVRLVWEIYLPLLKPGLIAAFILVFLDISKELPATYLLRPFGWDTLAIRIFELSAEALYERAAVPSLLLLLMGVVGLLILRRLNLFK
ncbi:iron ABC transporter substrate-binding protein [Thiosulfatimonas sediminis]|uniref:Iron ABC transporter substrate-binding protein n=2 Tax=Thiosulfatimonas sediminis TaxID=2675054 RepID=A0A6F8PRM8_9GAMM|nr:iron ABC transporter substrate-binding protein [Thiosulfatimonas sediminis]